jgi:hypothetical protein
MKAETKLSWMIYALTFLKIPIIAFMRPKVLELSERRSVVQLKLNRRTKNHLGAMYFGALTVGAELTCALKAVELVFLKKKKVNFLFKDFKAEFLQRAQGDVHFICEQTKDVENLIEKALASGNREEQLIKGKAFEISNLNDPIMTFELTLSLKKRT